MLTLTQVQKISHTIIGMRKNISHEDVKTKSQLQFATISLKDEVFSKREW